MHNFSRRATFAIAALLLSYPPQARALTVETGVGPASYLVADPVRDYIYATVGSSLEFINTRTLTIDKTLPLPNNGFGMSISIDNSHLFIAGGSSVNVVDLASQTNAYTLPVDSGAVQVAAGLGNRLFVLTNKPSWPDSAILQVDATTGASAGPNVLGFGFVYRGGIQITPDRRTLFYGTYGLSPGSLYKIDVSSVTPVINWTNPEDIGENGEEVVISPDGSQVAYVCGYGYHGYRIPSFSTSDMSLKGAFNTGAYPEAIGYSPDARYAYASHDPYPTAIDIYDTATATMVDQFTAPGVATQIITDHTGRHLFVNYGGNVVVYATGYAVPESASCALGACGILIATLLSRRPRRLA